MLGYKISKRRLRSAPFTGWGDGTTHFSEAARARDRVLLPRRCKLLSYNRQVCLPTDVSPVSAPWLGVSSLLCTLSPALHPKHQTENSSFRPPRSSSCGLPNSQAAGELSQAFRSQVGSAWQGRPLFLLAWLGVCQSPTVGSVAWIPCPFDTVSVPAWTGPSTVP